MKCGRQRAAVRPLMFLVAAAFVMLACQTSPAVSASVTAGASSNHTFGLRASARSLSQTPEVTHVGYLIDLYCWALPGRIPLDSNRPLDEEPERHTVHCLRDIPACINAGYALLELDDNGLTYSIKYRLDSTGNTNALSVIDTTSTVRGFRVVAIGTDNGSGTLVSASIREAGSGDVDGTFVEGQTGTPTIAPTSTPTGAPVPSEEETSTAAPTRSPKPDQSVVTTFAPTTSTGEQSDGEEFDLVVHHVVEWQAGVPYDPLEVTVGDNIHFDWSAYGSHDLYMMNDRAAFDTCDFSGATELAPLTASGGHVVSMTEVGSKYFSCSVGGGAHCNALQKIEVVVSLPGDLDEGGSCRSAGTILPWVALAAFVAHAIGRNFV